MHICDANDNCINENNFAIKRVIIVATIVFILAVMFGINISNFAMFENAIPNNAECVKMITIGEPRAIRSDEWLVGVSNYLYDTNSQQSELSITDFVAKYITPTNWGKLFLPTSMSFAFYSWIMYYILFIALLMFFRIFNPSNWKIVLAMTLITLASPGIGWWNSQLTIALFFSAIVLFYYFFEVKAIWKKVLICIGLVICLGSFIVNAYPAWMIPLAYLAVLVLLSVYIQRGKINIRKSDWIYIVTTLLTIIVVAVCYYISSRDFIEAVSDTVYPGNRLSFGGDLSFDYIGHYLMLLVMPIKDIAGFSNNSEATAFWSFFPLPWLVFICRFDELKKKAIIWALLFFDLACFIYAFIGFPKWIATASFWIYTTPARVAYIGSFTLALVLLLEIVYIKPIGDWKNFKRIMLSWKMAFLNIFMIGFLISIFVFCHEIVDYMSPCLFLLMSAGVIFFSNVVYVGARKFAIVILLVLTLISGVTVNPINVGMDVMTETPLAKRIVELNEKDKGNWITTNEIVLSKYVKSQGVECLNALSYPPRMDLFEPIDRNNEYNDIYNRYAHVVVALTDKKSSFELVTEDAIIIYLNIQDLRYWDVKYVVSQQDLTQFTDIVNIKKVYEDLDGFDIYKVM